MLQNRTSGWHPGKRSGKSCSHLRRAGSDELLTGPIMIFVHNDDIRKILSVKESIPVLESAFKQVETGEALERPRIDMYMPCEQDAGYYRWGSSEGTNDGVFAIRMK